MASALVLTPAFSTTVMTCMFLFLVIILTRLFHLKALEIMRVSICTLNSKQMFPVGFIVYKIGFLAFF